ncbi:hypothetical protein [Caldicellulosiruptor morganii]|uniref:Flp pilus-assembly TadG-like N-terminal domain-containing protein n=1 Tax=Caldicellulosiruptor morganii TaxID=1387555 RepID=A0ABY7BKG2_9FIRM|nr:hypothetical protein [Caldicellulosiruptor morganii]WAM33308.1 hypothetical protein OTK00_001803 [Caldicellulosiruptor morganii]
MFSEDGESMVLFIVLVLIFIFLPAATFLLEFSREMIVKQKVESAVVVSGFAALYRVNPNSSLTDAQKEDCIDTFLQQLKKNLNLNDDLTSKDNLLEGPLEIVEVSVYGADELPAVCTQGSEILVPGMHVVVHAKVKRLFFKTEQQYTDLIIHKDIDVFEKGGY